MTEAPVSHQMPGEIELIVRAQGNDLAAFDQLVLRHQQEVFAVALRMLGDSHEAQDVAQEAFVRAYRAIGTFRREAKLSTWLVSITMNLCRNRRRWWMRHRRVITASLDEPRNPLEGNEGTMGDQVADQAPSPHDAAERHERQQQVMQALSTLTLEHRSVIILRDLQGYSYEDIAQMLGCEEGTVKSRLHRARMQLRSLLDGTL